MAVAGALIRGNLSALPTCIPPMLRKRRAFRSKRRLSSRQIRSLLLHYRIRLKELSQEARPESSPEAASPRDAASSGDPAADCPACGSGSARVLFSATDRLYRTTTKIFQIVECRNCRLIRLHPQPSPAELRDYYPPDYWFVPETTAAGRLEQAYRRFVLHDHLRFVERAIRESEEDGLVLDVGCGGGLFLQMLRQRAASRNGNDAGLRVVGLDFSLEAANVAWRRSGVPAICATLGRAPIAPASCAAIAMFHVLEHLYDPGSYLEAAHHLLKPDGRLIVQVPNAACWQFLMLGERWNGIDAPRHLIDFPQIRFGLTAGSLRI